MYVNTHRSKVQLFSIMTEVHKQITQTKKTSLLQWNNERMHGVTQIDHIESRIKTIGIFKVLSVLVHVVTHSCLIYALV